MFEEVLAFVGRPWLFAVAAVAAVVGTKTGRKVTRTAVKAAVRASSTLTDGLKDATARVQEEFEDIVAEAKAEMSNNSEHKAVAAKKHKD